MAIPRPEVTLDTGDTIIKVRQYDETSGGETAFIVEEIDKLTGEPHLLKMGHGSTTLASVTEGDYLELFTGRIRGADGRYTYGY